jgi:hypothetical protein
MHTQKNSTLRKNILINGVNSKVGGGKSILNNYLQLLYESDDNNLYYLICPNEEEYLKYVSDKIKIIKISSKFKLGIFFPILYFIIIPKIIKKYKIETLFNLGDIPIRLRMKQIYLFDWPYAVYPEYLTSPDMTFKDRVLRNIKYFFFKISLKYPSVIIAQSISMSDRLRSIYGLSNIVIVPNAVSIDNLSGGIKRVFNFPLNKKKLLYLTHYYFHKNIEIFIPLAQRIRELELPYIIIITIEESQHPNAKVILDKIKSLKLDEIIYNIGKVEMANIPSLYEQSDALLMPTLLESFSGTYVEAMFHKKTIFTSNRDFAIDVCGNVAFYFDPLDVESILNCIKNAYQNGDEISSKLILGKLRLGELKDWNFAFSEYQKLLF